MDLFPTVADVLGLPGDVLVRPLDGISLKPLFTTELSERSQPIGFRFGAKAAIIDNRYKILTEDLTKGSFQLYDLVADPKESHDLRSEQSDLFARMKSSLLAWNDSVEASFAGKDYPEGMVTPADPKPVAWYETADYQPYLREWKERWEFRTYIERRDRATKGAKSKTKTKRKKKSKTQ
jgi:hypothetical protein